jgi:flagellar hook-length control protein FliK
MPAPIPAAGETPVAQGPALAQPAETAVAFVQLMADLSKAAIETAPASDAPGKAAEIPAAAGKELPAPMPLDPAQVLPLMLWPPPPPQAAAAPAESDAHSLRPEPPAPAAARAGSPMLAALAQDAKPEAGDVETSTLLAAPQKIEADAPAATKAAADTPPDPPPTQPAPATAAPPPPVPPAVMVRAAAPSAPVPVPVGHPGWDQALGERVVWLATHQMQTAAIHLNPPELGPIEVRIQVSDSQASISFGAPHAAVRAAIEGALPRLREMLGASGLHLADVNIGRHGDAWQRHDPRTPQPWVADKPAAVTVLGERYGLLDVYV